MFAAAGKANTITVVNNGGIYTVVDSGDSLSAGAGCMLGRGTSCSA